MGRWFNAVHDSPDRMMGGIRSRDEANMQPNGTIASPFPSRRPRSAWINLKSVIAQPRGMNYPGRPIHRAQQSDFTRFPFRLSTTADLKLRKTTRTRSAWDGAGEGRYVLPQPTQIQSSTPTQLPCPSTAYHLSLTTYHLLLTTYAVSRAIVSTSDLTASTLF
jgi:hypothetical protein